MMVHTVPEKQKQKKLFRPILVTLDDQERERGWLLFVQSFYLRERWNELKIFEPEPSANFESRAQATLELLKFFNRAYL